MASIKYFEKVSYDLAKSASSNILQVYKRYGVVGGIEIIGSPEAGYMVVVTMKNLFTTPQIPVGVLPPIIDGVSIAVKVYGVPQSNVKLGLMGF